MNLVCPGCQSNFPLPPHVQPAHPFNCPRCRYSGTVGAILQAARAQAPAPAAGGFQMPGPPQPASGFQMPGPPVGQPAQPAGGFQMPGPPQGFAMPGPPQPAAVTPVQVTPVQLSAPQAPQPAQPDLGWQDRSGVMSGEVNGALALVDDDDLEWKTPAKQAQAAPAALDLAPEPQRPAPAGGLELDLADEPEPEPDPDCDGFDPVDEDVPTTYPEDDEEEWEEGGYAEQGEAPAWKEPLKKAAPAAIGLVVLAGLFLAFGGDDEEQDPRKKRRRTASTQSSGGGEASQVEKPAPPPDPGPELIAQAEEQAKPLVAKKEFLPAIALFSGLPKDVKYKHGSEINPKIDALKQQAAEYAKAEATKLKDAGKVEEAMALLQPYLDGLTGRPRGSLNSLERQLKRLIASGAKPNPKPSPSASPAARPTPTPAPTPTARPTPVVRETPQPRPTPRRRFRPWTPKKAPSEAALLKIVPGATIKKTKHYVIVSTADEEFTKESGWMLESVRRGFYRFFNNKGFETREHDGPLVAFVFKNEEDFRKYPSAQGVSAPGNAAGFYHTKTNALYFRDSSNTPQARQVRQQIKKYEEHLAKLRKKKDAAKGQNKTRYSDFIREQAKKLRKYKRKNKKFLERANDSLTIHEAVHQLCYNAGILTPSDLNPEWVVEGLAMLFEEEAVWKGRSGKGVPYRIGVLKRRAAEDKRMTVRDLVASNQQLISRGDAGLAYSSAWALIHMFVRGKFRKYKHPFLDYLKGIQQRSREAGWEVRGAKAAQERLARFEKAFGKVDDLESEYKAYVDKLID